MQGKGKIRGNSSQVQSQRLIWYVKFHKRKKGWIIKYNDKIFIAYFKKLYRSLIFEKNARKR